MSPAKAGVSRNAGSISSTAMPRASSSVGINRMIGAGSFAAIAATLATRLTVNPVRADLMIVTRSSTGSPIASRMPRWNFHGRKRPGAAEFDDSRKCCSAQAEYESIGGGRRLFATLRKSR